MFLPIGDQPNPKGTPFVNYALIAANVAVFALVTLPLMSTPLDPADPATLALLHKVVGDQNLSFLQLRQLLASLSQYDLFLYEWGYRTAAPSAVTLLTAMFLHGGWLHIFGNMLFLWIYGDNVEHRLGPLRYLLAYLGTGVAATLAYSLVAPAGDVPMVGASGAISGVLGLYFVWFPRNKVRLLVVLFPFYFDVWRVNARIVLGFYLLIENLLPFWLTRGQEGGGVAYGAHIGGFVAGLAGAWLLSRASAKRDLSRAECCEGLSAIEIAERGRRAFQRGDHQAALGLYRQALQRYPSGPNLDVVFLGIATVLLYGKRRPTAAFQYLMDALEADPSPEVRAAVGRALRDIEEMQKMQLRRH